MAAQVPARSTSAPLHQAEAEAVETNVPAWLAAADQRALRASAPSTPSLPSTAIVGPDPRRAPHLAEGTGNRLVIDDSAPHRGVSLTRDVIVAYFSYLEQFQFREAAHVLTAGLNFSQSIAWSVVPILQTLTVAESLYYSLAFIHLRPNYLIGIYESLHSELNQATAVIDAMIKSPGQRKSLSAGGNDALAASLRQRASIPGGMGVSEIVDFSNLPLLDGISAIAATFYSQLIKQLVVFALIRKRMIAVYLWLAKESKDDSHQENITKLNRIEKQIPDVLNHALLAQTRQTLYTELGFLQRILKAQVAIRKYRVEEVLMAFEILEAEINTWAKAKFVFWGISNGTQVRVSVEERVPLLGFFKACKETLRERIQFFFGSELRNAGFPLGNSSQCVSTIQSFCERNYHCYNISVILEPSEKKMTKVGGIRLWHAIYTFPQITPVLEHWPAIISLSQTNEALALGAPANDSPVIFSDPGSKTTYYLFRIEFRLLLVFIFISGKPELQASADQVTTLAKGIIASLRYSTLLRKKYKPEEAAIKDSGL